MNIVQQAINGSKVQRNLVIAKQVMDLIDSDLPRGEVLPKVHEMLNSIGLNSQSLREIFLINMYVMSCNFTFNENELLSFEKSKQENTTFFSSMITGEDFTFEVGIKVKGVTRFNWIKKDQVTIRLSQCMKFHAAAHDVLENELLKHLYDEVRCEIVFDGMIMAEDYKKKRRQELQGALIFRGNLQKDMETGLDKFFAKIGLSGRKVINLIDQFYEITYLSKDKRLE